ncbi:hypothetical protein CCACVL1_07536 [Corchorus capsularis]|uniref:Uncharacterized protein n=1 Tax=Corchorus capsularis TaxID=210143 RepID=A0A1R3J5A8_COCAP|nr:hypothetical protein CCACVL1_07536 [Corchorus capsularis]
MAFRWTNAGMGSFLGRLRNSFMAFDKRLNCSKKCRYVVAAFAIKNAAMYRDTEFSGISCGVCLRHH